MRGNGDGTLAKKESLRALQEYSRGGNGIIRSWQGLNAENKGTNGLPDGKGRRRDDGAGEIAPESKAKKDEANTETNAEDNGMDEDKPQVDPEVQLQQIPSSSRDWK